MRLLIPDQRHSEAIARLENLWDVQLQGPKLADRIVVEGEAVIAYGVLHSFTEGVQITDLSLSAFKRAKAMDLLIESALIETNKLKLEQLHAFVKDPKWAASLEKHYGFVRNPNSVLIRNL
jgi:hypothetical protein